MGQPRVLILSGNDGNRNCQMENALRKGCSEIGGPEEELQTASERLGHASTDTTNKHYRSNVKKVMPLVSYKK